MTKDIKVLDCDREAAVLWWKEDDCYTEDYWTETLQGKHDGHPLVQAFARHRIAAITAWNTVEEISARTWKELDRRAGNPSPRTELELAQYCDKLRVIAAELIQKHEILDDPIVIRARELCAEVGNDNKYLDGSRDDYHLMRVAVRALKEGFGNV